MDIPHSWTFKHKTWGSEKRLGWLFDIIYGAGIISLFDSFDYIFTVNSECILEKPKDINRIIGLLGDSDIMSSSSEPNLIHTCNVIWKRNCFLDFVSYIRIKLNNNIPESYSPEILLRDWVSRRRIRVRTSPIQPIFPKGHFYEDRVDHYSSYNQDSTWKEFLGYRNLGGEFKTACQEHLESVDVKYFDLRNGGEFLNKHERDTLLFYLINGDRRYLYKYWSEGEDSFFNRRYYPIEYYGNEPLYDDSKRKELGPPSERLGHFNRWKYNSYIIKDDEYKEKWKKLIKEKGYDNE